MNNALTVTFRIPCRGLRAASPQTVFSAFSLLQSLHWPCPKRSHSQEIQHRHLQPLNPSFGSYTQKYPNARLSDLGRATFSSTASRLKRAAPGLPVKKSRQDNVVTHKYIIPNQPSSLIDGPSKAVSSVSPHESLSEFQKHPQLRFEALSQTSIKRIFGPTVPQKLGNDVLRKLQSQRATGTLDNNSQEPKIDPHLEAKGLLWLRSKYPFDEDAAIMRRIELEDVQTEAELIARAEKIGLYKPTPNAPQIQDTQGRGIYGHSVLDDMHKHYKEKAAKSQVEKEKKAAADIAEETRNISQDSKQLQSPAGRAVLTRRTESAEWVKRYKERAMVSDRAPEKMHPLTRLWPSGLFTLIVIGASILFAQNYVPPPRHARLLPDTPPAAATVQTLVLLNVAFFMMWRAPPLWRFMNRYCIIVTGFPKWQSMLGNVFSHQEVVHLATNMVGLWFIGTQRESFPFHHVC